MHKIRLAAKAKEVSKTLQRLKAFCIGVLSKFRRADVEVESVKCFIGVLCMPRLNFVLWLSMLYKNTENKYREENVLSLMTLNLPNIKFWDTTNWKPPYSLSEILVSVNQNWKEIFGRIFLVERTCQTRVSVQ